ncbi:glycosyltransferase, partial [Escherichia coli]
IDSILSQTFKDFELIIVNDASPENLDSIISSYDDTRIRYYKNDKNCGAENVIDNWNKCLSFANGDYFILMGDDDKLDEDYLSEFNKIIT